MRKEAVRRIAEAADVIQSSVEEMGFVTERSKGFCLASSEGMGKALQAALGDVAVTKVQEEKRLGVAHWWRKTQVENRARPHHQASQWEKKSQEAHPAKKVDWSFGGSCLHWGCAATLHIWDGAGRGSGS